MAISINSFILYLNLSVRHNDQLLCLFHNDLIQPGFHTKNFIIKYQKILNMLKTKVTE